MSESSNQQTYILNTNTKQFHKPECYSVKRMSERNKKKHIAFKIIGVETIINYEVSDPREHFENDKLAVLSNCLACKRDEVGI